MEEHDPKPSEAAAAAAAAEGQRQPESSPSGGSGGGGGPGDADTGRRRALMLPAALQAPGNHQLPHRITNFFIDNILRPEFGRRKDAGTCCAGAGGGRGSGAGGEGGAGGAEGGGGGGGGGGAGGAEQLLGSGREPRQSAPGAPGAGGPLPGGCGGGGGGGGGDSPGDGEGGSKALSLHGGAKKGGDAGGPLDGALKARALGGGGDLSVSSDSDSSQAGANLGAQPMLWPAWVYCTRYSDRPSSGERRAGGPRACGRRWPGLTPGRGRRAGTPTPAPTPAPSTHKDAQTGTLCAPDAGRGSGSEGGEGARRNRRGTDRLEKQKPQDSLSLPLSCFGGHSPKSPALLSPAWSLFGET
ncbi:Homeobox protein engrailed-2 [Vulpes lagopus]